MANLKMPDINNVLIAGNLTCDPSFRKTTNGTPVTNFFIASNRKFKDNNGQWRENVCYIGVVAWYKLAESCYENIRKGSAIIIDGELQSRSWRNDDGTTRNVIEIKARRIQFLNRKDDPKDESDSTNFIEEDNEYNSHDLTLEDNLEAIEDEKQNFDYESEDTGSQYDFGYKDLNL
ncbi:MAG: single-stranded DNA-binding protein [bacterium]|nr:single-stranded DNA-binding protein [bacterium]